MWDVLYMCMSMYMYMYGVRVMSCVVCALLSFIAPLAHLLMLLPIPVDLVP